MSSLRSSVRPKSSKQQWGTILEPEFGMGHQKMTAYEIDQTVERLYRKPRSREPEQTRKERVKMNQAGIDDMLQRLTKNSGTFAVDRNRTQNNSIYKDMGVVNSYAWKGYN